MREERRAHIVGAFAQVLAQHGYAGATIAAVAARAGVAPGLVHHHFADKDDLLQALLATLVARFRQRIDAHEEGDPLIAYIDAALALDERADITAARCWVGVFAEAVRSPSLFKQVRRLIDVEIASIERRSGHRLSTHAASAVLAFVVGSLVVGAFAPAKAAGFAAPELKRFVRTVTA
jgi:TetR/AcrR family transcriptional repressor of bet genes